MLYISLMEDKTFPTTVPNPAKSCKFGILGIVFLRRCVTAMNHSPLLRPL